MTGGGDPTLGFILNNNGNNFEKQRNTHVERAWLALFGELAAMIRESYNSTLTEPPGTS